MPARCARIELSTEGDGQVIDVTDHTAARVDELGLRDGVALVFIDGATGGLTTMEAEPGAVRDLRECLERLAPAGASYHHDAAYHDGNGHSHLRAALVGPDVSVPVSEGALLLGTWQRVVFLDFDNRPRRRALVVQCVGEFA